MVEHTQDVLILGVVRRRTPPGESVVIETPAIGNTFPARTILACIPPGEAKILSVTGEHGPRNSPVAGLARDGLTNREIGSWLLVSLCPEVSQE
jgi:hypothetical protein